jgi:hypothetical protein
MDGRGHPFSGDVIAGVCAVWRDYTPIVPRFFFEHAGAWANIRPHRATFDSARCGSSPHPHDICLPGRAPDSRFEAADARPDGRNTATTDTYQNVDLALARYFTVRPTTIEARIESFNILNVTNYDQYVGTLLSPLYAQPVSVCPNRRMQFGVTLRF